MKTRGPQLAFSFLLGVVVGGFALVAIDPLAEPESPSKSPEPVGAASVAPIETSGDQPGVHINPKAGDLALARHLEQAGFDDDWRRVVAVAKVLRKRASKPGTAAPVRTQLEKARRGGSLIEMDHAYRRRAFLLELAARDNAATRAVAQGEVVEQERALIDLFQAPDLKPEDRGTKRDAAYLLATLQTERGRQVLLRALEDPDPSVARMAVEGLGRAEDPKVVKQLDRLVQRDPDPKIRARAVRSLTYTLGSALDTQVVGTLVRGAVSDRDLKVRTLAIAGLARANVTVDQQARGTLKLLAETETEQPKVRLAALAAMRAHRALARSLPVELVRTIEGVAEKSSGKVRLEAIAALADAGDAKSLPILEATRLAVATVPERKAIDDAIAAIKRRADEER